MSWQQALDKAIELRHWFHQNPELTWQEKHTAQKIRDCLDEWQISWRVCAEYGTVATIGKDKEGMHIALRADMDALPIEEKAPVDFVSQTPGKMHACGHDGHMAALLGAAFWLKQKEADLDGPVSFLFQPAEEGGHGAKKMIEDGALDGIDQIFGWHNWPAMPFGKAACPNGPVMSSNGSFQIRVEGVGGHASQPEACKDPLLAASAINVNLQQIVSRRLPPQASAVISVTSIVAESSVTIIPHTVQMSGGIRLSDPSRRDEVNHLITEIAEDTAKSYGVKAKVEVFSRYDSTINDPKSAQRYREVLTSELGEGYDDIDLMMPLMASEDFSYYLKEIPGAFALLGMSEQQNGENRFHFPCHNPYYEFNDRLLERVMRSFSKLTGITPA